MSIRIDEAATQWAVRLAVGILPTDEQRELEAWQAADTRHRGALIRARATQADLNRVAALSKSPPLLRERDRGNRRLFLASAAALFLTAVGLWVAYRPHSETYVSAIGEMRRVTLSDGSSMLLNTSTRALVRFDQHRRQVQLERGEALFEVAKDSSRPFIVRANEVSVTALSTAFAVRMRDGRVDVTVTEGVVEVAQPNVIRRLEANQKALVTPARLVEIAPVQPEEIHRRLAWREGMVAFNGEPLSEAVAEVNRHSERHIVVDDPGLAARPIVGIFRATDLEGFAATAATALDAEVVPDGEAIRLRPRPTP